MGWTVLKKFRNGNEPDNSLEITRQPADYQDYMLKILVSTQFYKQKEGVYNKLIQSKKS